MSVAITLKSMENSATDLFPHWRLNSEQPLPHVRGGQTEVRSELSILIDSMGLVT